MNSSKSILNLPNIPDLTSFFEDKNLKTLLDEIVFNYFSSEKVLDLINASCDKQLPKILIDKLDFIYENKLLKYDEDLKDENLQITEISISIIRNFSNESVKFRNEIHRHNGIKVIFKYLKDSYFLKCTIEKQSLNSLFRNFIGCLENLCKSYENFKNEWKNENSLETILNLSEKSKNISDSQLACYMILAFTTEEEEIAKFPDIYKSINGIVDIISEIALELKSKNKLKRIPIEIDELDKNFEVLVKEKSETEWNIIELLDALYHMAVNDSLKINIYFDNNMSDHLRTLIENGNDIEKAFSIKLLWQLCFNFKVSEHVFKDSNFLNQIDGYSSKSKLKELSKNSQGCIWTIHNKQNPLIKNQTNSKHIMISYNRENRDLCLSIKKDLEKKGHKIWIDVHDIHGSSLEAMAKAIEESKGVLICMTEKYKMSSNCRLEAEYALQINKPIIPLIMQKNYQPDGWLGLILGAKIYVNFTKYEYDECLKRLFHEIKNAFVDELKVISTNENKVIADTEEENKESWTEEKVEKWINDKKFNEKIANNLLPCNGKMLKQLNEMLYDAPEFFYSSINSDKTISLRDVLYFTTELKYLFKI